MPLLLVVQRLVAEGIALEGIALGEAVSEDQRAAVAAVAHLELVLAGEEVLVVFALARVLLLLGVEGEDEVLAAAVPGRLLLGVQGVDEETPEDAGSRGFDDYQVETRLGQRLQEVLQALGLLRPILDGKLQLDIVRLQFKGQKAPDDLQLHSSKSTSSKLRIWLTPLMKGMK